MAEAIEDISDILRCKVCLDRLQDPKMLVPCYHIFCKECLEGLIRFRSDGSGDIRCPNRCLKQTRLKRNQTVEDLKVSYEIKAIIETLEKRNVEKRSCDSSSRVVPRCTYSKDCHREISVYCCWEKMCKYCHEKHAKQQSNHFERKHILKSDKESGDFMVMCEEHQSQCTHLCIHEGKKDLLICTYCLNRAHKEHTMVTIEDGVLKMKESLEDDLKNIAKFSQLQKVTEENISHCLTRLDDVLLKRKRECMSKYIDLLSREEQRIKKELVSVLDDHVKQYSESSCKPEYYQQRSTKNGIDLLLERNRLPDFGKFYLSSIYVFLSDCNVIHNEHPLGTLKVSSLAIAFTDLDTALGTLKNNIAMLECPRYKEVSKKLSFELREARKTVKCYHTSGVHFIDPFQCDNCLHDLKKVKEHKLDFIAELIRNGKITTLAAILENMPEVLELRNYANYTLLHVAVTCANEECIRWLCNHYPYLMEVVSNAGYTPLHCAADQGLIEPMKVLLSCGANPHAKNNHDRTPLDETRSAECERELRKWM